MGIGASCHTPLTAEATGLTGAAVCLGAGPALRAQPNCLHDCTPSCLTRRWWAAAWPRVHGQMHAGPQGACSDHTYGFPSSESLTFQQNFCSSRVLLICMLKENLNKGKVHIKKKMNPSFREGFLVQREVIFPCSDVAEVRSGHCLSRQASTAVNTPQDLHPPPPRRFKGTCALWPGVVG